MGKIPVYIFTVLLLITNAGCKKHAPPPMRVTINGSGFTSAGCSSTWVGSGLVIASGVVNYGSAPTVYPVITIILTVKDSVLQGNYTIDGIHNLATLDSSANLQLHAHSGTVNITTAGPDVIGTFEFTCNDGTKVTDGSFDAIEY